MDPAVVDCRSLIDFCRSFKKHHRANPTSASAASSLRRRRTGPLSHPFCEHSSLAALDAAILLSALAAVLFLAAPSLSLALRAASAALALVADAWREAPLLCGSAAVIAFASGIALWEVLGHHSRKCGNPFCRGLRKAVEFDIQLESEECVRRLPPFPDDALGVRPLELGSERKELEAELKRMAPPNGRTVLIFRAPCGCPAGRMEVWGPKRLRRIKK